MCFLVYVRERELLSPDQRLFYFFLTHVPLDSIPRVRLRSVCPTLGWHYPSMPLAAAPPTVLRVTQGSVMRHFTYLFYKDVCRTVCWRGWRQVRGGTSQQLVCGFEKSIFSPRPLHVASRQSRPPSYLPRPHYHRAQGEMFAEIRPTASKRSSTFMAGHAFTPVPTHKVCLLFC